MNEIGFTYKNSYIEFDEDSEMWIAYLEKDKEFSNRFKENKSLQKLKDAIDRFNKKEFKLIPIYYFSDYGIGTLIHVDIISFTDIPGICWIRHRDGHREKLKIKVDGYKNNKIYSTENIANESILLKISETNSEIEKLTKDLEQRKKEKIHLIASLQPLDVTSFIDIEEDVENI